MQALIASSFAKGDYSTVKEITYFALKVIHFAYFFSFTIIRMCFILPISPLELCFITRHICFPDRAIHWHFLSYHTGRVFWFFSFVVH
jgi:hypothetical protein